MRPSLAMVLFGFCCTVPLSAQSSTPQLDRVRAALDKYRDPVVAVGEGYLSTVVCMDFPAVSDSAHVAHPAGGMGVHLLNAGLIGPQVDSLKPQVLIYEPVGDTLKLVAAEWFVPVQVAPNQPELFGRKFDGPMEGHPPIMPTGLHHWDLCLAVEAESGGRVRVDESVAEMSSQGVFGARRGDRTGRSSPLSWSGDVLQDAPFGRAGPLGHGLTTHRIPISIEGGGWWERLRLSIV